MTPASSLPRPVSDRKKIMIAQPAKQVGIFLHVATIGRYQEVLDEMLAALIQFGLFHKAALVQVNVVGAGSVLTPTGWAQLEVVRRADEITAYEHPSLEAIREFCRTRPKSEILYLNCLGGRHVGVEFRLRAEWRRLLVTLLVERHRLCRELLEQYDVCGVDWSPRPLPHMTSNNWWANAKYVNSLPSTTECVARVLKTDLTQFGASWAEPEAKKRHAGEFWLGMNEFARPIGILQPARLGLPIGEFGTVPWWGMPSIPWATAALLSQGVTVQKRKVLEFEIQAALARMRCRLRALRTHVALVISRLKPV